MSFRSAFLNLSARVPLQRSRPEKRRLVVSLGGLTREGAGWRTGWSYRDGERCREVTVSTADPSGFLAGVGDAALPPSVLMGMLGPFQSLQIRGGKICPQLREGAAAAARVMQERFEESHPVLLKLHTRKLQKQIPKDSPLCVCFTGGVDSCFSALDLREQSSALMFVRGFDIPTANRTLYEQVKKRLDLLAADLDLPLIEMETNLRLETDFRQILWGKRAFGVALASMAHLLPDSQGGLAIPASYDVSNQLTAGSMPELDPLWSSARRRIIHHGVESSRYEKIRRLAEWPLALKHLRVCWMNPENAYNCGRCEKCVRTLVLLEMAGLSKFASAFDGPLELSKLPDLKMTSSLVFSHWEQIYDLLKENSRVDALRRAVQNLLDRNRILLGLDG
ncbi:MAG: hypothetical protein ACO3N7_03360 [Kiritimatiellia bacterium]